jgi:hypothetical protein
MLKKGGWRDCEVDEMIEVTTSGFLDDGKEAPTPDSRLSSTRWSSRPTHEDVSDALGLIYDVLIHIIRLNLPGQNPLTVVRTRFSHCNSGSIRRYEIDR